MAGKVFHAFGMYTSYYQTDIGTYATLASVAEGLRVLAEELDQMARGFEEETVEVRIDTNWTSEDGASLNMLVTL